MHNKLMQKILLFIFLLFSTLAFGKDAELTLLTENAPPNNYLNKEGKLTGGATAIIQELIKRTKHKGHIEILPWPRAYKRIQEEENVGLFCMGRTPEREDLFLWLGPLFKIEVNLMAKKTKKIKLNSLQEAKNKHRIGTIYNDVREQFLRNHGFTNLDPVNTDPQNALKLYQDRIDLWVVPKQDAEIVFRDLKIDPNLFESVYTVQEFDLYLAFSKNTHYLLFEKWKKAFGEIKKDGTLEKMRKSHHLLVPSSKN